MLPSVKNVSPMENYQLRIVFDNGEEGILDMKPYLDFGVFKRLREMSAFRRVRVSFDTLEWDVGVDLDPEFVYQQSQRDAIT